MNEIVWAVTVTTSKFDRNGSAKSFLVTSATKEDAEARAICKAAKDGMQGVLAGSAVVAAAKYQK